MASATRPLETDGWQTRLALVVETMREVSRQSDPQEMVRVYGQRARRLLPRDDMLALSRRGLEWPHYRITRSSKWKESINPWKEKERLPLLGGGLLAELIYSDEPRIIDDLTVASDEPAAEYLTGHRSLLAIPLFDQGTARNMVIMLRNEPAAFDREQVPNIVQMSNLFGLATNGLLLAQQLKAAYETLDQEFQAVGNIQRSLLPAELPRVPTLDLAAYYHPSRRAGGDYYDFFPLPGGKWGVWIADVSCHGTPAAVLMAVTHTIAHTHPGPPTPPGKLLGYVNKHLTCRYTADGSFVTAFYGIYDPANRTLTYACAGHNPPRLKRCQDGTLAVLDHAAGPPLGIFADQLYAEADLQLQHGDQIIFYTDGITEAHSPSGAMFGTHRLDEMLENCSLQATALLDSVLQAVDAFTAGAPAEGDRTVIVARVV